MILLDLRGKVLEMGTPKLNLAQIQHIAGQVADFIAEQRQSFAPLAEPLSKAQRASFEPYFPANILTNTRFLRVDKLADPPFYPELEKLGFTKVTFVRTRRPGERPPMAPPVVFRAGGPP